MPKKNNVSFTKPPEPEFIRRMKERVGWREGPTVDTKFRKNQNLDDSDDDHEEPDEEKPTVLVLKEGDLSEEEAQGIQRDLELDDKTPGKFRFKKPIKSKEAPKGLNVSSKRTPEETSSSAMLKKIKVEESKSTTNQSRQRQLLSFGDECEEDN
jgi:hypothetical protein